MTCWCVCKEKKVVFFLLCVCLLSLSLSVCMGLRPAGFSIWCHPRCYDLGRKGAEPSNAGFLLIWVRRGLKLSCAGFLSISSVLDFSARAQHFGSDSLSYTLALNIHVKVLLRIGSILNIHKKYCE